MKRIQGMLLALLLTLLMAGPGLMAWGLDSPGEPTDPESEMYSLEAVYDRLATGAPGTPSAFTEPSASPAGGVGRTLNEVMGVAPATNTNAAVASQVLEGRVFWGLDAGEWGEQVGTASIPAYPGEVPKTGQTTSFRPRDDGDLQKGVAWPDPRFTVTTHGTDEVVTDNLTGLIWVRAPHSLTGNSSPMNWDDAIDFCNDLTFAGHSDWRLPNVRELQSLIDYGRIGPALPAGHPFTIFESSAFYWSSSTWPGNSSIAWTVTTGEGILRDVLKVFDLWVWPVRGGQLAGPGLMALELDSPGEPTDPASEMYSLEAVYDRLATGVPGTPSAFTEPSAGPAGGVGRTLNEVMGIAPATNANAAVANEVLEGRVFWGLDAGAWGAQVGTASIPAYPGEVPKTGQTTSYRTGDDGYWQQGVAWPDPRFTVTTHGTDEVVTDNLTGLMWEKAPSSANWNWTFALIRCNNLTYAGHSDWRLPNVRELQSLIDYGQRDPALPAGHPFTNIVMDNFAVYWASTGAQLDSSDEYAWRVRLDIGSVDRSLRSRMAPAWCTRGGNH